MKTAIDQNFVSQIECYNCRQKELWNGRKFGIVRGGDVREVRSMLMLAQEGYWDNWHAETIIALYDFGRVLCESSSIGDERDVASTDLTPEQYQELKEAWEATKNRIDSLLA